MKHLKTFKNINTVKEGDYVILNAHLRETGYYSEIYMDVIKTHVARITEISGDWIYVEFESNDDDSDEYSNTCCFISGFKKSEIKYHSRDLSEMRIKMESDKYNL